MSAAAHDRNSLHLNCVDPGADSGIPSLTLMQRAQSMLHAQAAYVSARGLRIVSVAVAAVCLLRFCAAQQKPQKHEHRHHEIDHLEEAWRNALLACDIPAMNSLLADDYTAITSNGTMQTKEDWLASLRSGRVHVAALDISDRRVRFYGDTAVVTSRAEVEGSGGDGEVSGSFRYTRVYVRDAQGNWKIVSFEASRITHMRGLKTSSD